MALLLTLALRLLPIIAIVLWRRGAVSGWLLVIAIAVTVVMVVVNLYGDYLRGTYAAHEFTPDVIDSVHSRLRRLAPLRLGTWLVYVIVVILLLIME
jgi:hypothetical protein